MKEQEIKQKITEILSELEKIEDKKENQEKIFELLYELKTLRKIAEDSREYIKFKKVFLDIDLTNYPNSTLYIHKYLISEDRKEILSGLNIEIKEKELEK